MLVKTQPQHCSGGHQMFITSNTMKKFILSINCRASSVLLTLLTRTHLLVCVLSFIIILLHEGWRPMAVSVSGIAFTNDHILSQTGIAGNSRAPQSMSVAIHQFSCPRQTLFHMCGLRYFRVRFVVYLLTRELLLRLSKKFVSVHIFVRWRAYLFISCWAESSLNWEALSTRQLQKYPDTQ